MRLFLYRHPSGVRNFGDELGSEIFPRLLPGMFDDDPGALFLGIGSILFADLPASARKVVLGAGFAGYTAPPRIDRRWSIYGVRGPLTCRALALDAGAAIGDPAVLLRTLRPRRDAAGRHEVAVMPHWQSLERGQWRRVAELAGMQLIDPREPVPRVIEAIEATGLLLAEAMHGAIVADALRVPWVALRPIDPIHRFKWLDWAASLELVLRPQTLAASSLAERIEAIRHGRRAPGRRLTRALPGLRAVAADGFAERAAESLRRAAASEPCLSADAALDRCIQRIGEALDRFRRDQGRPA